VADLAVAGRLHAAVRAAGGNKAVARRSGVPLATLNNYVRGRNGMKIEPLAALAVACDVSLDWLVSDRAADPAEPPAVADFPIPGAGPSLGLADAHAGPSPAGLTGGIDLPLLAKAVEIVAAIAGVADFRDDPKGLARRIATTYAMLIEPEASRD
jgi:hypothetical protein